MLAVLNPWREAAYSVVTKAVPLNSETFGCSPAALVGIV
jgi:hypothetical protein